ncbi:MAG: DUF554 domain-containing protein [Verrucomicrobiales bacterium]
MTGTIINVGAIIVGGVIGLTIAREISARAQMRLKLILGILTIYAAFTMIWQSINGTLGQVIKQTSIAMLALILGNVVGRILRIQKGLNKLGEYAKTRIGAAGEKENASNRFSEGFVTCTILFCVGPMAILGSLQDGLTGDIKLLGIKSVMDGLATLAFVKTFGPGPILAAVPVLAYQGTITLTAQRIEPFVRQSIYLDSVNATGGLIMLCIAVVILGLQKVPLADYLPALIIAPLLTWLW